MLDELKEFYTALVQIPHAKGIFIAIVGVLIVFAMYRVFVKKDNKLKAVIKDIIVRIIKDAKDKGITVEIIVDDIIKKAEAKILEKPDKYDALLLYFVRAKWFKAKLTQIISKIFVEVMNEEDMPANSGSTIK